MPKAGKTKGGKGKVYDVPSAQGKRKDGGVPKINAQKLVGRQAMPYGKSKAIATPAGIAARTIDILAASSADVESPIAGPSSGHSGYEPVDSSLTRDSSSKAFMRELRKVVERSDVIIQVLDARDPEGTRSRWVEEEVRKRESQGKKLLAVVNKIDLVPRANLEAWLKYLRHSFPCMPFKSSTQSQKNNLSQNAVPLAPTSSTTTTAASSSQPLPSTSASLGAPALLHLLKQYALSTPHSALTVGVVGYPNVGKSSLINSLKRSRACAVAAMPGKTRVVQEVVLDKGVKILDCPGVVLEDVGREMDGEEGRRKAAEIMLRNCIKAELVDDPVSPVEVILSKVDPALLEKTYNIPPFDDIKTFLISIALTRGRLGKGGIPDLQGSAVSVLRDWNSGKIPYFTAPPTVHPSSAPAPTENAGGMAVEGEQVGDAKILNTLSEAFTLEGLFDHYADEAAFDDDQLAEDAEAMAEDQPILDVPPPSVNTARPVVNQFPTMPMSPMSDMSDAMSEDDSPRLPVRTLPIASDEPTAIRARPGQNLNARLFTAEELAVLPDGVLDRQKQKQLAKKAKKRKAAAGRTEDELMLGFMDMGVEEPQPDMEEAFRPSKKALKKQKKKAQKVVIERPTEKQMDDEARKEAEFANFLANVGGDDMDEEL